MDESNKDTSVRKEITAKSADFQWKFCLKVLIDQNTHTYQNMARRNMNCFVFTSADRKL